MTAFSTLLSQRTPPGPQYIELIHEISRRGFEVFVVGGTVRDVLSQCPSQDVDIVTTMPIPRLHSLVRSMYGRPQVLDDGARRNGHLRPGGRPGSGDPYIDISLFKFAHLGSDNALFADSFDFDVRHRDFACNAIYYDPINSAYIDPTGTGVQDAEGRLIRIVVDPQLRNPYYLGQIIVRFFKFQARGYQPTAQCLEYVTRNAAPYLASMDSTLRSNYIKTQLFAKVPAADAALHFDGLRSQFDTLGVLDAWHSLIAPLRQEILG
jgi:hypothetical protein